MSPTQSSTSKLLGLIAEKVPANVFVFNLQTGRPEFNSASVGKLVGYNNDEILAMGDQILPMLMHPDDIGIAQSDLGGAHALGDEEISAPVEYRMRAKDDTWVWFSSSLRVLDRDEQGNVKRVIGSAHPIKRQKEAEQGERDAKLHLTQILDATPISIIGFDGAGQIVSANNTARHILDGASNALPFKWPEAVKFADATGADIDPADYPTVRAIAGETFQGETFSIRNAQGKTRYVSVSTAQMNKSSSPIACVMTLEDVTERETQRQQLERSSRLDALGQLTGGIAHDFNNLLAIIGYALQLGLKTGDQAQQKAVMQVAQDSIGKGAELTSRLLAFAKRQPGTSKTVNLATAFSELGGLASRVIEESVQLEFAQETPDLLAFCDPPLLESALMNLILNARDVITQSGQGSRISVYARGIENVSEDAKLRSELKGTFISGGLQFEHHNENVRTDGKTYRYIDVSVSDDGPGMTEDVKRRAVDPFFSTKDHAAGTGLGLSMVYGFVRQANGELRIYSEPGQGTTVRMLLPRGNIDGNREKPVEKSEIAQGHGQRILLVEDEPDLQAMMAQVLTAQGYQVTCASSGEDALTFLRGDQAIDLMITDIVMPGGIGGFELAATACKLRPRLPLIYMSGYAGFIDEQDMTAVAPLLRKPTPPAELFAAINAALKEQGSS